ncbi:MAG: DM13 domain-containing protein [Thermoleophilaceae bacterium]
MRRALAILALAPAALMLGCGSSSDDGERADPFQKVDPQVTKVGARAAPRWEPLATVSGSGSKQRTVEISERAIQWRARWRCMGKGRLSLSVDPRPRSAPERPGGRCPGKGEDEWIQTGRQTLKVEATGRWRVVIEQQVDTALREPPLKAMRSPKAKVLSSGRFYEIERRGRGKVSLYRLPSGRLALRMDNLNTSSNTDLFVWLSEAARPRNTKAAVRAPHVEIAALKSTLGSQNYLLPRSFDAEKARSVVIWCEPIRIAYTAAPLR